ncbi:MAG: redoxin domain-containing protein [Bacteroidetes bacterium]|nr:redoxin domain-containing protein [Bacteroidota bacterium]
MKRIFLILITNCILATSFAQNSDSTASLPVYLRFPNVPEFTIYKAPDSTAFTRNDLNKKKNIMFFVFSPECGHCQHETEVMLQKIKEFKNTQIVMVTYLPYNEMLAFYHRYHIDAYPQIVMGRDTKFFFPVFFKVQNFPSMYIYQKGKFKQAFEGAVKIEDLIKVL